MKWANFIHIYQPPAQKEIWIRRITKESYRKLFSGFLTLPKVRLTLNINSILCELLERWGGEDVIDDIRELIKQGKLELTGSAKYHAFLPLLPEEEMERQIRLNEEGLDRYFGGLWEKKGFFSPEMAYSKKVAEVASRMGYEWIIIDELGFPVGQKYLPDRIYQIEGIENFNVFFRERALSFAILSAQIGTVPTVLRHLSDRLQSNEYVITAMDGETFGHHRPGMEQFLFNLLSDERIDTAMISDLTDTFPKRQSVEPRLSTWAATEDDIGRNEPFARWQRRDNPIQQCQWALTELAITIVRRTPNDEIMRQALDRALHSDQYWWSSARPWWSLEMIEGGAFELKNIIISSSASTAEEKQNAENCYREIVDTSFAWQRSGKVDELARKEDEDVLGRMYSKETFFITKEEYVEMITTLKEQSKSAAAEGDFHRAAMLKDRIRELIEEVAKKK